MGFLSKLIGTGISSTVGEVANIVDKFVDTKEEKKQQKLLR